MLPSGIVITMAAVARKEYPSAWTKDGKDIIVIPANVATVAEKKNTQGDILLSAKYYASGVLFFIRVLAPQKRQKLI